MAEQDMQEIQPPVAGVGARLSAAREAQGLSRADVAARTKIAERHLIAIEEGRLSDLASRTYAVGFSRSFARAVGLDEHEIAQAVREELASGDEHWDRPQLSTFEPGDPARVPPSRVAWLAGIGALAVIGAGLYFWQSQYDPAVSLPDLTAPEEPVAQASTSAADGAPVAPATAPAAPTGAVTFTALEPDIWVKFYDASGAQLMQKQMAKGEVYTVPADAAGPMLWTARPDALQVSIGGRPVPMLAEKPITMKDIPVTAAALTARPAPAAAVSATPASTAPPSAPAQPPATPAVSAAQ